MSTMSQRSFTGGEISAALFARVDQTKYQTGLKTCRNFFIMRHGGVTNRPGSQFISEVKDSSQRVRLIPFAFNTEQTYILEFGNQYIRIYRQRSQAYDRTLSVTGITQANPAVVTSLDHGISNGNEIHLSEIQGMTELNDQNFKVTGVTPDTFELNTRLGVTVNSTGFSAYTSSGTLNRVYTLTSPYLEADLSTLQYTQSADVLTIVHPNYAPRELTRSGLTHTVWTLTPIEFKPKTVAPTGLSATLGSAGLHTFKYQVTAVDATTREESLGSSVFTLSSAGTASGTAPHTISWAAVPNASEYNIYRESNGIYGFIGIAGTSPFLDVGLTAETSDSVPTVRNPFSGVDKYPGAVAYVQQRLLLAGSTSEPETVHGSRTGHFKNFTTSVPTQDDDAFSFTMAGRQVNRVRHLLDLGKLITFTTAGEWAIDGDQAGIIKPGEVNPKQYSYNGSTTLPPIVIGGNALYVQARGSIVRDLGYSSESESYRGSDLTVFSAHLFDGYQLIDWAYQQIPHSIVWAVRSDGTLLGLTYVREHQLWGWHRHDFPGGVVENVASVGEGDEDAVYLVIKREINGETRRYIERLSQRRVDDIRLATFTDSHLSYDGRNQDTSHTMILTGGTTWGHYDGITIESSTSFFKDSDNGNEIHFNSSDGLLKFRIMDVASPTEALGQALRTVPEELRNIETSSWARAVDEVSGLWHLEGERVSVLADGFVVSSPLNAAYESVTVSGGRVVLDHAYSVIHVGLPYVSDLESLDLDTAQGETIADKKKRVSHLSVHVEASRGLFAGTKAPSDDAVDPLEGLYELKMRDEENYSDPVRVSTGVVSLLIEPQWNFQGRIFIRQIDPLPLSVLSLLPEGQFPFRGG